MAEILITSSVLILALTVLRYLLRGKFPLRLQYGIWAVVALRLLVPVSLGSLPVSVLNAAPAVELPDRGNIYISDQGITAQQPPPHIGHANSSVGDGEYFPGDSYAFYYAPNSNDLTFVPVGETPPADYTTVPSSRILPTPKTVLTTVWWAGMTAMAGWFVWVNLSFRRKLRESARRVEVPDCPLPVFTAEGIPSPCLVGLFRPAIYVTPACLEDKERLRHVLAHELTHWRHKDPLWSLVRCLCLTIYWFDPLVWLAASLSRRDCELACDEGALARLGEEERTAYGRTLIGLMAESSSPVHLLQTATTMVDRKRGIRERLLLIAKKPMMLAVPTAAVVLAVGIAAACTFTGAEAPAPDGQPDVLPAGTQTAPADASFVRYVWSGSMYDIRGYDASAITWTPPQNIFQSVIPAHLYFANPRFFGPFFQDKIVEGGAELEDGVIRVSFTVDAGSGTVDGPHVDFRVDSDGVILERTFTPWEGEEMFLSDEEMIQIALTLREMIQHVAARHADLLDGGAGLSPAELDWFNTEFFNHSDDERRINNMMLASEYSTPADINLYWLFYDGLPGSSDVIPAWEQAQLEGMDGINLDLDLTKITAGEMAAVFREKTGLSLDETNKIGLDSFVYLPEYTAYYHTHGDTNYAPVTVTAGRWAADGTLTLEYDRAGSQGTATLRNKVGEEYLFISNTGSFVPSDPVAHSFDRLLADDYEVLWDGDMEDAWASFHLPWDQLEHTLLDLDGDGERELLVQYRGNDPQSTSAVFHYEDGKVRCWNFDYMDGNEFQYPLRDGSMVHEFHFSDSFSYTLFRYNAQGERQELASLAYAGSDRYTFNHETVTQQEFNRQVGALIGSRLVGASAWSPEQPYTGSVASEEDWAEVEALRQALPGVPATDNLWETRPGEVAAELLRQHVDVYTKLSVGNSLRLLSFAVTEVHVFDMDSLDQPTHICFSTDWAITGVDLDRKGDWVAGSGVWPIEDGPYAGQWDYHMQGRAEIVDGVWRITELGTGGFSVDDDGVFLPDFSSCRDSDLMYFLLNRADGAYAEGAQYELGERFLSRPGDILNTMTWFIGVQPENWPDDDRDGADWLVQMLVGEFTVMRPNEDRAQFEALLAGFGDEDCGGMAGLVREALEGQ